MDTASGDVYTYTYSNGNILSVKKNGVTVNSYAYADTNWSDKLTAFNGNAITYDAIGNPLNYHDGKVFTWIDGRRLSTVVDGDNTYSYTYDSNGNRIRKTVNGANTQYIMAEGVLLGQNGPGGYLFYFYDESGRPYGFLLNASQAYYYEYNLQGGVIGIFDSTGAKVVTYTYDPWGKLLSTEGSAAETIGLMNPIRYRGYYYDTETGFYFLQTRYYDPEVGRFLNADGYVSTGQGLLGNNMYAYCGNNPVVFKDTTGTLHERTAGGGALYTPPKRTNSNQPQNTSPFLNPDGSISLYDNDRFGDNNPWHEQGIVITPTTPNFSMIDGDFGFGGADFDLYTGGWETQYVDASLFDFGHLEAKAHVNNNAFKASALASAWSPAVSFDLFGITIEIGAEVASIGGSLEVTPYSVAASGAYGIGFSFSINWEV